jgi:hypothetical protein
MTIAQKLVIAAASCGYVQKDGNNAFHKYRYASAANILGHVNDALTKAGLAVVETLPEIVSETGAGKDRVVTARMTIVVGDTETAERVTFRGLGSGMDSGDKAVMKAITAATKYAWMGAFSISTGDDPEADEDTDKRAAQPAKKPASERKVVVAEVAQAPAPDDGPEVDGVSYASALAAIDLPGKAVAVWLAYRSALGQRAPAERVAAWEAIAARVAEVGRMASSKAGSTWLKKAIAEEDARAAIVQPAPEAT